MVAAVDGRRTFPLARGYGTARALVTSREDCIDLLQCCFVGAGSGYCVLHTLHMLPLEDDSACALGIVERSIETHHLILEVV